MDTLILIRYGEIALKGQNRGTFEDLLVRRLEEALRPVGHARVVRAWGRMYVQGVAPEEVMPAISRVFGVVSYSPVLRSENDLDQITASAVAVARRHQSAGRFKVDARRALKSFPYTSLELNRLVGSAVQDACPGLQVDLERPDFTIYVEVRPEGSFVYSQIMPGPGGLPVGASGHALLLISGGIDSPVAGWLAMKRGIRLAGVHFHSYPYTSPKAQDKVVDLFRVLARWGGPLDLYMGYFTHIQEAIEDVVPERLHITVMRRMMLRLAEAIARQSRALALVTGESIGQVASQTLESMQVIGQATGMNILRPVVAMDKAEITVLARQIGTFDISSRPYEDCCTLFVPRHPATKPRLRDAEEAEARMPVDDLLKEAIARTEKLVIAPD